MKIFTYYQDVPELTAYDEIKLIQLWRERWAAMGTEPIVLNEWHARQHPEFEEYDKAFANLPSVNPTGYDRACYMRWLAVTTQDELYPSMTDYDVIPYEPKDAIKNFYNLATGMDGIQMNLLQGAVPSLVCGNINKYVELLNWFKAVGEGQIDVKYENVNGRPHTSDMYLLEQFLATNPEGFFVRDGVKLYLEEGWLTSDFVHYSNSTTQPAGKNPRWKHIPDLRKDS